MFFRIFKGEYSSTTRGVVSIMARKKENQRNKVSNYFCPYDSSPLGIITMKYLSYNRIWSENAPLLCCPSCSKEFVGLRNVPHMTYVKLGGVRYLNLHKGERAERKKSDNSKKERTSL